MFFALDTSFIRGVPFTVRLGSLTLFYTFFSFVALSRISFCFSPHNDTSVESGVHWAWDWWQDMVFSIVSFAGAALLSTRQAGLLNLFGTEYHRKVFGLTWHSVEACSLKRIHPPARHGLLYRPHVELCSRPRPRKQRNKLRDDPSSDT